MIYEKKTLTLQEDSKSSVTPSPSPDKQRDSSPERAVSPPTTANTDHHQLPQQRHQLPPTNGSSQPPSEVRKEKD